MAVAGGQNAGLLVINVTRKHYMQQNGGYVPQAVSKCGMATGLTNIAQRVKPISVYVSFIETQ